MTVIRTGIPQYMANLEAQRDVAITRAEAAEQRVAELEEVALLALEELERPYDELKKYEGIRGRNDARYRLRAALNKDQTKGDKNDG